MLYFVFEIYGKSLWNWFEKIKSDKWFKVTPLPNICSTEQFDEKLIILSILQSLEREGVI